LPKVRIPTAIDRKRIENVTRLLFVNKSIDRAPSVDEIVFSLDEHFNKRLSINNWKVHPESLHGQQKTTTCSQRLLHAVRPSSGGVAASEFAWRWTP
jgi:hypothetical protein